MILNPRQTAFVREYLIDQNATQAAIRAGYSVRTANRIGSRLLTKVDIQTAIAAGQARLAQRAEVTVGLVISGLLREANREDEGSSHAARVAAWTQLGKHIGMFADAAAGNNTLVKVYVGISPVEVVCQPQPSMPRLPTSHQNDGPTGPSALPST